jgi:hypothetical protein
MGVPKFHALDHLVNDNRQCGSLSNYSADFYAASHKLFKVALYQNSRRSIGGQAETLARVSCKQGEKDAAAIRLGMTDTPIRSHVVDKLTWVRTKQGQRLTRNKGHSIRVDTVRLCGGGDKMDWYKICSQGCYAWQQKRPCSVRYSPCDPAPCGGAPEHSGVVR